MPCKRTAHKCNVENANKTRYSLGKCRDDTYEMIVVANACLILPITPGDLLRNKFEVIADIHCAFSSSGIMIISVIPQYRGKCIMLVLLFRVNETIQSSRGTHVLRAFSQWRCINDRAECIAMHSRIIQEDIADSTRGRTS